MPKRLFIIPFICFLAFSTNSNAKPTVYQQALNCKPDNCPTSTNFVMTPKVKKVIIKAFEESGANIPPWLFSGNSVSTPTERVRMQNLTYIKISICKPHDCGFDNLEGYYNPKANSFVGVYEKNSNKILVK